MSSNAEYRLHRTPSLENNRRQTVQTRQLGPAVVRWSKRAKNVALTDPILENKPFSRHEYADKPPFPVQPVKKNEATFKS